MNKEKDLLLVFSEKGVRVIDVTKVTEETEVCFVQAILKSFDKHFEKRKKEALAGVKEL